MNIICPAPSLRSAAFYAKPLGLLLLVLAGWCGTPHAQAATVITSLPYVINTPGDYVLESNLKFTPGSGNAISFNTGNVALDFAGHMISGSPGGSGTQAQGLHATNRPDITIKNGSITGFYIGIWLDGPAGGNNSSTVIDHMRLSANTYIGIYMVRPYASKIENCQISRTGGSPNNADAYSIYVYDGSITVRGNQISTTTAGSFTGAAAGIYSGISTNHFVVANQIDNCETGLRMDNGAGKRKDNLTGGCTSPFSGGVDVGGNN